MRHKSLPLTVLTEPMDGKRARSRGKTFVEYEYKRTDWKQKPDCMHAAQRGGNWTPGLFTNDYNLFYFRHKARNFVKGSSRLDTP